MPHVPSDVSVSDLAAPISAVLQIRRCQSDTGNDCMDIRPHYNSIPTVNWYRKVVVMSHAGPQAIWPTVSDAVPAKSAVAARFGTCLNLTLGMTAMHIRPHYHSIQTLNWY